MAMGSCFQNTAKLLQALIVQRWANFHQQSLPLSFPLKDTNSLIESSHAVE